MKKLGKKICSAAIWDFLRQQKYICQIGFLANAPWWGAGVKMRVFSQKHAYFCQHIIFFRVVDVISTSMSTWTKLYFVYKKKCDFIFFFVDLENVFFCIFPYHPILVSFFSILVKKKKKICICWSDWKKTKNCFFSTTIDANRFLWMIIVILTRIWLHNVDSTQVYDFLEKMGKKNVQ